MAEVPSLSGLGSLALAILVSPKSAAWAELWGDYNGNGQLDAGDLDMQAQQIVSLNPDVATYDLTNDGEVNFDDRKVWVEELKNTWIGDADLNGEFKSSDMVQVFAAGKYETGEDAGWAQGDWNGDGIDEIGIHRPGSGRFFLDLNGINKGEAAADINFISLLGSLPIITGDWNADGTDEIGIFRAIGFRNRQIMKIVFMEAAIVSGLAGVTGYFLGFGATKAALVMFNVSHSGNVPFSFGLAGSAVVIALVVGLISSAYPAFMAARLDPNEALRAL